MNQSELPRFVRDVVCSPPPAGNGVHQWLFRCACLMHHARTDAEIISFLEAQTLNCGREVPEREIVQAVKLSKARAWQPGQKNEAYNACENAWPKPDLQLIHNTVSHRLGLYDLWEASPRRFDDAAWYTEELIDALFPGNPLLCVAHKTGNGDFATRRRELWRGHLHRSALLVPSPMVKVYGKTQTGRRSQHSLAATGPRKYLIAEFDISPVARDGKTPTFWVPYIEAWKREGIGIPDACSTLAHYLAGHAPLVLVVSSGGKSLHAWFRCAGADEEQQRAFMQLACKYGADSATWTRNQFVRMPDGTRKNGQRQTVFFFNPDALEEASRE